MLNEEQIQIYLDILKRDGRIDKQGRVVLSMPEQDLLIKLAADSKYFYGLLEQIADHGSVLAKAFAYFMDAMKEEEKRMYARTHSTMISIPDIGETITIPINVAVIKDIPWTQTTPQYGSTEPKIRYNKGIVAYAGGTEVFFWGTSDRILRASLQEKQSYKITGQVKDVRPGKIELTRISAIAPM